MWMPLGWVSASGGVQAASFELISTTLVSSSVTSVTLTLPGSAATIYKHLQVRITARAATGTDGGVNIGVQLNNDTAANYSGHRLYGNGTSPVSDSITSSTYGQGGRVAGGGATASVFGAIIFDLLDAFSTTKNKTFRALSGTLPDTYLMLNSGAYYSTSTTSAITFINQAGSSFAVGSRFSLYGVRG